MASQADTIKSSEFDDATRLTLYKGEQYAFPAKSTLKASKGFAKIHRLQEDQINVFDVSQSLEVKLDAQVFNKLLGIYKTKNSTGSFDLNTNQTVIAQKDIRGTVYSPDDYWDASKNYFIKTDGTQRDDITLDAGAFAAAINSKNQIISVGKFSTLYSDFTNYVASYFGLSVSTTNGMKVGGKGTAKIGTADTADGVASGFATLFSGVYQWDASGGEFGASQMYNVIHGNGVRATDDSAMGTLAGSIKVSDITNLLRYAVDSNCFNNRDPQGTTGVAIDSNFRSNYGVTDGFLADDLIFIPNNGFAITLNLNINYQTNINSYMDNNIGQRNVTSSATLSDTAQSKNITDASGNAGTAGQTGNTDTVFHTTQVTDNKLLQRTVSCPLLIRLYDP
jgi:hypothetical protein